jgi:3-oxoadipate enol-lactonase
VDTTTSSELEVNGIRLVYSRVGASDAAPMVLLHAGGQDRSTWNEIAPALARRWRLYAPDLRGHGSSSWPGAYSFELMRDDVLGFVDTLGLTDVTLVGHSLGATVAWLVAEQRPAWLTRLIVEDTVPPKRGDRLGVRPRGAERRGGEQGDAGQRGEAAEPAALPKADPRLRDALVEQFSAANPDWWDGIARVAVPTLLFAGGPDSQVPQDRIAEAAAIVPDARLVEIPVGHHVHRERPSEFLAAIEAFSS